MAPHGPGNRLAYTVTQQGLITQTTAYAYDRADRLTSVGGVAVGYDNRGNLTNDGTWTYTYDSAGRMVRAEAVGATHVYTYSGDGLLVAQNVAGAQTAFTWDHALELPQVLATSDGVKALYGLARIGLQRAGQWYYAQADALGSARQWTDATGAIATLQGYEPYGVSLVPAGPPVGAWRYAGEWEDRSGLVYLRARWYDPRLGSFTQADPVGGAGTAPATQHAYMYAFGNPLRFADPSGRDAGVLYGNGKYRYILESQGLKAAEQAVLADYGRVNDLEGMAIISDLVAATYPDWDAYLAEMGTVFNGLPGNPADLAYVYRVTQAGDTCAVALGRWWEDCPANLRTGYWADTGFHPDYQDAHGQPYHVWAFIRQTARRGRPWWERLAWLYAASWVGLGGNVYHEVYQSCQAKWRHAKGGGNSWEDFWLAEAGMAIGTLITSGAVRTPHEVGDVLRRMLGPGGPGVLGLPQPLQALFPLARYDQQ